MTNTDDAVAAGLLGSVRRSPTAVSMVQGFWVDSHE
jgi:hypothetical protein